MEINDINYRTKRTNQINMEWERDEDVKWIVLKAVAKWEAGRRKEGDLSITGLTDSEIRCESSISNKRCRKLMSTQS